MYIVNHNPSNRKSYIIMVVVPHLKCQKTFFQECWSKFFSRCIAIVYAYQFISLNSKIVITLNPIFFILSYLIIFDRGRQKGVGIIKHTSHLLWKRIHSSWKNFIPYSKKRMRDLTIKPNVNTKEIIESAIMHWFNQ